MEQNLTVRSFIVRLYRVDTEDTRKITGLVEALDGSGMQAPFRDIGELAEVLQGRAATARKSGRKAPGKDRRRTGERRPLGLTARPPATASPAA